MSWHPGVAEARRWIDDVRIEEAEDERFVNLCANENVLSNTALGFLRSPLGNRYRIGAFDPQAGASHAGAGDLLLRHFERIDALERAAHAACLAMFGGVAVDLRPLSGVHATLSILLALTEPGATVYSIDPRDGGHFATRHLIERSNRNSRYLAWDSTTDAPAWDSVGRQFDIGPPNFILLDHGAPRVPIDTRALRSLAGPRAIIDCDASHTLGLIAGGRFHQPLREGCDLLHGNTHKSFPGPQKALIVFNDMALAGRVKASLSAGLVSSQHTHHLVALCVTLLEMQQWGRAYATQMLRNAEALGDALAARGFVLATGSPSKSHLVIAKVPSVAEGRRWFELLRDAGVATNVRALSGGTVMRLGVQEVTRRGFTTRDMAELGERVGVVLGGTPTQRRDAMHGIARLRASRSGVRFSLDEASAADGVLSAVSQVGTHAAF